jgi:hypothetical protein
MSNREIRRGREGKERRRTIGLGGAAGDGGADVGVEAAAMMDFPSPTAPLLDRSREGGGAVTVAVNLMSCSPSPHLLFIGLRDRGPPTRSRLSIPDQDAVKESELAVGPIRLRSIP